MRVISFGEREMSFKTEETFGVIGISNEKDELEDLLYFQTFLTISCYSKLHAERNI